MSSWESTAFRDRLNGPEIIPCIGVYDVFSATLAARRFQTLFLSGFSFSASFYGLPDTGYISWSDMVAFCQRVRAVAPGVDLLVDMDDGYVDGHVAGHVVRLLEGAGASGIVLEDQSRPKKCGHFPGKQIVGVEDYLRKLDRVLQARRECLVVARTDADDPEEALSRLLCFEAAGADALLADGIKNVDWIRELRRQVRIPILYSQIAGGKGEPTNLAALHSAGVSMAIYSTPCLFAAQAAVEEALETLAAQGGLLTGRTTLAECNQILTENEGRVQEPAT